MAKHSYRGSRNSRAQRQQSKIFKGMRIDEKAQIKAFKQIEKEKKDAEIQKR